MTSRRAHSLANGKEVVRNTCAYLHRQIVEQVSSLNRLLFLGIAFLAFTFTLLALRKTWFSVPFPPLTGTRSVNDIVDITPACTTGFQAVLAIGLVGVTASWLWKFRWNTLSTLLASLTVLVPLSYPYFVMIRSPVIAAEATYIQSQHDNLTWLGGDIYANAEYGNKGWKSKCYIIDAPNQLSVVELPSWSPWEIGLHRCEDLMLWLGYSNAFCQFAGKGWALAILGSSLLLLTTFSSGGELNFSRVGISIACLTCASLLAMLVGWSLPFQAAREIRLASLKFSSGEVCQSGKHLDNAVTLLPVLGQDTYYVAQRGVIDLELGVSSDYATLRHAIGLEANGRYDQAFTQLKQLCRSEVVAVRREAQRAMLRFAIQDYNCARFELARDRFHEVFRYQPCNVKLIYLLQLQAIRESRIDDINSMRDWMYAVSDRFNFGTKKVLRAVVQQNAVLGAGMAGDADEIWEAQKKAKRP